MDKPFFARIELPADMIAMWMHVDEGEFNAAVVNCLRRQRPLPAPGYLPYTTAESLSGSTNRWKQKFGFLRLAANQGAHKTSFDVNDSDTA